MMKKMHQEQQDKMNVIQNWQVKYSEVSMESRIGNGAFGVCNVTPAPLPHGSPLLYRRGVEGAVPRDAVRREEDAEDPY